MEKEGTELLEMPFTVSLPFRFATGPYMGRFLREIRDNKKFVATRCGVCGRTLLPPSIVCPFCHVKTEGWVELGTKGTLVAFDIVHIPAINPMTGKPRPIPYARGYIMLDGGNAIIGHFLEGADPSKIKVGARVEAVFKEEGRRGEIADILCFRIIEEGKD